MNIVSKKSTLFGFVLAGLVIGSMPTTAKAFELPTVTSKKMLIAFVLGSLFVTSCKETVSNPEKVDWINDLKKLVQVQNIFTPEFWNNFIHIFNDGILGQVGKGDAILSIPNEDGTVTQIAVKPKPSTGIFGTTLFWTKALGKKAKDIGELMAFPTVMAALWVNAEKFAQDNSQEPAKKEDKNNSVLRDLHSELGKILNANK